MATKVKSKTAGGKAKPVQASAKGKKWLYLFGEVKAAENYAGNCSAGFEVSNENKMRQINEKGTSNIR